MNVPKQAAHRSTMLYWKIFFILIGAEYIYSAAKDFGHGFVRGLMSHVVGVW